MEENNEKVLSFRQLRGDFFGEHISPDRLWHYTSAQGLNGIIQDNGKMRLFFTRSDCLNDYSEGNDVLKCYHESCSRLWKTGRIDDSFYQVIKDLEVPEFRRLKYRIPDPDLGSIPLVLFDEVKCDVYICCFSMKEDSLDMWRYYSKSDGGYALGLCTNLFYDEAKTDPAGICSWIGACRVIYSTEEKIALLSEKIVRVYSAFLNDKEVEDPRNMAKLVLQSHLECFQYQFKHECFSSEQEYRFLIYLPHTIPDQVHQDLPHVSFRTSNGVVVPYIECEIENGNDNLFSVMISPYISEKQAEATTRDFLKSRGFSKCDVTKSALPVRF